MLSELTVNDLWTLGIAAYAAVISTFVLGWDAYKWLASGARIQVEASPNMELIGGAQADDRTYISVTAYNVGDRATTITNLGVVYFDSWWKAYFRRRRPDKAYIVTSPSEVQRLPYRFEVGDQWMGLAEQTANVEELARKGYVFFVLYTATRGASHRVRLTIHAARAKGDDT